MDAWKKNSNDWSDITKLGGDFQERVSYDANGNILTYKRNGNTAGSKPLDMDKLAYSYKPGTNQLDHVYDTVPAGNYDADLDAQAAGNYEYDRLGNLVKDNAEGITNVSWNAYGKISRITKGDSVVITYTYGPDESRISKTVTKTSPATTVTTWYVRDARGNVISVYESGKPAVHDGHLTQTELHLYGSSRLGVLRRSVNVDTVPDPSIYTTMSVLGTGLGVNFGRGEKLFELSNHLGNVLVTVDDKKLGVSSNNTTVDYFNPQVVSAQDYYPFGMLQPGRSVNVSGYRYGFNGKENDNEMKGEGNQLDYGMRVYDTRLGRFLSVDPLTKDYPRLTPYQFASNSPVSGIDLDGLEYYFAADGSYLGQSKKGGTQIRIATKYHMSMNNGKLTNLNIITESKDLGSVKFDKKNVKTLVSIIHHFSKDAEVDLNKLYNKDISVSSLDDIEERNWPVERVLYNEGHGDIDGIMSTDKTIDRITVRLNNGYTSDLIVDAIDLISTFYHEGKHVETEEVGIWEHLKVYRQQIEHKSWKNTTEKFKNNAVKNIRELIESAKAGNPKLNKKDNGIILKEALKWEKVFKKILGKDYERKKEN